MEISNAFLILFALFSHSLGVYSQQQDGLYNFVTVAMEEYPSWIEENQIYPTLIPEEIDLEGLQGIINISSGKIWNQTVSNFENSYSEVWANLIRGELSTFNYFSASVTGNYEMEGTIFSSIPIQGSGSFNIIFEYDYAQIETRMYVTGFGITPEGHINLQSGDIDYNVYLRDARLSFEGLSAGGYESEVEEFLNEVYKDKLRENGYGRIYYPLAQHMQHYLEELFAKTHVSEIIGATLPPTTTDPNNSTSTRVTDTPPCKRVNSFGEMEILSEEILERNVTTGANGESILRTKKLMLVVVEDVV